MRKAKEAENFSVLRQNVRVFKVSLKSPVFFLKMAAYNRLLLMLLCWTRFKKCVSSLQNTNCAGLPTYGGGTRFHVWTLTHLVYPSAGELHFSVDSDGEQDVPVLREVNLGPRADMLHWVGL